MNKNMKSSRRDFLLSSGSLVALSALPLTSQAYTNLEQVSLQGIVVYREQDVRSSAYAAVMAQAGMKLLPLAEDPVRQWRDQVQTALLEHSVPMVGLTDWADFQLMRELNGELRRHPVKEEMQPKVKDGEAWAVGLALKQIDRMSVEGRAEDDSVYEVPHHGNLFSWEIS